MRENGGATGVEPDPDGLMMYEAVFGEPNTQPLVGLREFTVNHVFGKIWRRSLPPIDEKRMISLRERSLITVALLAAQGRDAELRKHLGAARHLGISKEQIIEIMIHVAHYAGWPAGNHGQRVALEVWGKP